MNRFLKHWTRTEQTFRLRARIAVYADDFVILSRGKAEEALEWSRDVLTQMGLTLNMTKTSIKDARTETFDFLGYSFGPHRRWNDGELYMGASPSKKSIARLRARVREVLRPSARPWPEICAELNAVLRGWSAYFNHGTRYKVHTTIDTHVVQNVRGFLTRRHKVPTRGTRRFSYEAIFGELGVVSLRRSWQPYHREA
jgi:RNA-directed DNA polymerase